MSKKLAKVLILSLIGLFGLVGSAGAMPFVYTTTDLGPDPDPGPTGIIFSLTWNLSNHATLEITVPSNTSKQYWAGGFLFKFDQSYPANITPDPLNVKPTGTGPWQVSDGDTDPNVHIRIGGTYNDFRDEGGKSGFYLQSVSQGVPFLPNFGVNLSLAGIYQFEFDFGLTGGTLRMEDIPFKVAIYSGTAPTGQNRYKWEGWISKELRVPEPSTLLLLGAGLVGFGILGRRKFRS